MKWILEIRKKLVAASLVGAAAAIVAAVPYGMASAADAETGASMPPPRMERRMGPGPAVMPQQKKLAVSHRVQQMVRDGRITSDQAFKLNEEIKRFQHKQHKERRKFITSLPDKTGIDRDTLKEIFAPPQRKHM